MQFVKLKMNAWLIKSLKASIVLISLCTSMAYAQTADLVSTSTLRVCGDPANWPQSNEALEGYENKIAEVIAKGLERKVEYFWFPMSTGFVRRSLAENQCDVIIGYSAGHELVLNTNPYMTASYILVTRKGGDLNAVDALSDDRLKTAQIGLVAGTAPVSHLGRLGLLKQIKPYPLFVDRRHYSPTEDMLNDLMSGATDAAIIWGPIGAPFIQKNYPDLVYQPLLKEEGQPVLFVRITMGVRQGELEWKRALNSQIRRNQAEINAILQDYGIPLLKENGKELLDKGG